jgi:hypothetical protein
MITPAFSQLSDLPLLLDDRPGTRSATLIPINLFLGTLELPRKSTTKKKKKTPHKKCLET